MNTETLIKEVYYAFRGKGASKVPPTGSEKYNTALAIANRKKNEWARDSDMTWASNFSTVAPNEIGTVSTVGTTTLTGVGTYFTDYAIGDKITVQGETVRIIDSITSDTVLDVTVAFTNTASGKTFTRQTIISSSLEYSLHRNLFVPSDKVNIVGTTNTTYFTIDKPQERITSDTYISGRLPKKLTFYNPINTQDIGGVLRMAGYYIPDDMVLPTDLVTVDDPNWLVYATAAELARNDAAKEAEFSNLLGMANELYRKMITANNNTGFLSSTVPINAPIIGDYTEDDWSM